MKEQENAIHDSCPSILVKVVNTPCMINWAFIIRAVYGNILCTTNMPQLGVWYCHAWAPSSQQKVIRVKKSREEVSSSLDYVCPLNLSNEAVKRVYLRCNAGRWEPSPAALLLLDVDGIGPIEMRPNDIFAGFSIHLLPFHDSFLSWLMKAEFIKVKVEERTWSG